MTALVDWIEQPLARAAVLFAILLLLVAGTIQILRRLRGHADDETLDTNDLLTNFREMHAGGGLSDEEYQNIKHRLANQMHAELNDSRNKE